MKIKNLLIMYYQKYNLNQLMLIHILKLDNENKYQATIKTFKNNKIQEIGNINLSFNKDEKLNNIVEKISNEILFFIINWWNNKYIIDNSKFNKLQCDVLIKNFDELQKIKSTISNFSQVKDININNIQLNRSTYEFSFYGDFKILLKSFSLSKITYKDINGCTISLE